MKKQNGQWLSIGQAARHLGVSRDTLRRWEKKGKIKAIRSPSNRRYYTKKQLDQVLGVKEAEKKPVKTKSFQKKDLGLLAFLVLLLTLITAVVTLLLFR